MSDQDTTTAVVDSEESEPLNVEERLTALQKEATERDAKIDEILKASAGKDKKIQELQTEKTELQKKTMSSQELFQLQQKELEEEKARLAADTAEREARLKAAELELEKRKVLEQMEGFPAELADYVHGTSREEIEIRAQRLQSIILRERGKIYNLQKTTGPPKTGDSKPAVSVNASQFETLPPKEQKEWATKASDEEFAALIVEQQQRNMGA